MQGVSASVSHLLYRYMSQAVLACLGLVVNGREAGNGGGWRARGGGRWVGGRQAGSKGGGAASVHNLHATAVCAIVAYLIPMG